jgi:glycosyltransferase involved in cell wall biosynthesis
MIVKNEEHCLRRCLDSVCGLGAELIVVDTGSTDATPAIAASYGAEVTAFEFSIADFSAARNRALARASGRWIMSIDADEILRPSSVTLIQ